MRAFKQAQTDRFVRRSMIDVAASNTVVVKSSYQPSWIEAVLAVAVVVVWAIVLT